MGNLTRSRARSQKRARMLASLSVGAVVTVISVGAVLYWPRATANVRITKPGSGETIALPATLAGRASGGASDRVVPRKRLARRGGCRYLWVLNADLGGRPDSK